MPFLAQASNVVERVDNVFLWILALCVLFLVLITFLMIYYTIKYRRKVHPRGVDIEDNFWLETTWTVVPLIIFMFMFYYGWTNYEFTRHPPRDAMVVKVTGRQWQWAFEYPNGKKTDDLFLAINRPVKTLVRSADVLHGFSISAFRVKIDAVAGKENYTWFTPTQLGVYDIQCTVICGNSHSYMLAHVSVVDEKDFKAWYFGDEDAPLPGPPLQAYPKGPTPPPDDLNASIPPPLPIPGEPPVLTLLRTKNCLTCHSIDGRVMVGPTFKGAFGGKVTVVSRATSVEREAIVDEEYLKQAIQDPLTDLTKGYPPTMPPAGLTDQQLDEVIQYIKSLK